MTGETLAARAAGGPGRRRDRRPALVPESRGVPRSVTNPTAATAAGEPRHHVGDGRSVVEATPEAAGTEVTETPPPLTEERVRQIVREELRRLIAEAAQ